MKTFRIFTKEYNIKDLFDLVYSKNKSLFSLLYRNKI